MHLFLSELGPSEIFSLEKFTLHLHSETRFAIRAICRRYC